MQFITKVSININQPIFIRIIKLLHKNYGTPHFDHSLYFAFICLNSVITVMAYSLIGSIRHYIDCTYNSPDIKHKTYQSNLLDPFFSNSHSFAFTHQTPRVKK